MGSWNNYTGCRSEKKNPSPIKALGLGETIRLHANSDACMHLTKVVKM